VRTRIIVAVGVAVMLAGTIGFAQSQGRAVHTESTGSWEGVFVGGCINDYGETFDVMNRLETSARDTTIYDKKGQIAQVVRNIKFTTDIFWNSLEPEKSLRGGPGESEEIRWTYENGETVLMQQSGNIVRIILRGYGPIYIETGHARVDPNTYEVYFNSGWNHYWDGDPAAAEALCNALK
jgi:hypothetical protein